MKIREIKAKSILQKSGIPGADWVINPYTGCSHACVYCYAAFMKKWTGHMNENWGNFVDVKINAPELLKKEIKKVKKGDEIFLSSVCDPYQEVEKKYKLTRKLLEIIADCVKSNQISVSVLTKSNLIIRDLGILKNIKNIDVGFSMGIADRKYQKIIEPGATSFTKRAKAMKKLHDAGIKTYLFISPIIPGISNPKKSIELTKNAFDYFMAEAINTRSINYRHLLKEIKKYFPQQFTHFDEISHSAGYWQEAEKQLKNIAKRNRLDFRGLFRHGV
jgi:DNA repair photolyase